MSTGNLTRSGLRPHAGAPTVSRIPKKSIGSVLVSTTTIRADGAESTLDNHLTDPYGRDMRQSARFHYFTVSIPYAGLGASQWHPTDSTGPWSTLTRGAFETIAEAHEWAKDHLNGHPYEVVPCAHYSALALATGFTDERAGNGYPIWLEEVQ
jgi:hypothetical protein